VKFPIRLGKFKSTRILAGASGLLLALILVAAFVSPVSAVPQLPHQFFGTVNIDGVPAPEGTEVVARIANVTQNFTTAVAANHTYGWSPTFNVLGDDPNTTEKEGGNNGDNIDFYVAGTWATNFTFKSGAYNELNLTVPGYNLTVNVTPVGGGNVTVNEVTPSSYPNTTTWVCDKNVTLNATAASGYIFVNWSGDLSGNTNPTNITMDSDKNVTANFAEVTTATLEGHVGLKGLPATNITVRFFAPNTTTENVTMKTHTSTDSSGNFTIGNLTPGTYDVAVKGSTSLSNLESGVSLTAGNTTYREFGVLLEGDAIGDDYVDAGDFGILNGAWLSWPGQPNWDARADFSRDSYIDASDFGLLSENWLKWGDCFGWPGGWT